MNNPIRRLTLMSLLACYGWLGLAAAGLADSGEGIAGRVGLSGDLGMTRIAATDLNAKIEGYGTLKTGSVDDFDKVLNLGYNVHWAVNDNLMLGMSGAAELMAGEFEYENGDQVDVDMDMTVVGIEVRYCYLLDGWLLFSVGGSFGFNILDQGEITITEAATGQKQAAHYHGTAILVRPCMGYDFFLGSHFALGFEAGYQFSPLTVSASDANAPWDTINLAASGLYGAAGLRLYW